MDHLKNNPTEVDKWLYMGYSYSKMNSDERLKELLLELAQTINDVITDNRQIKEALINFEKEGYHVDLILASITKVAKKDEDEIRYEFNPLDKAFLNAIKIKLE